jgi:DNA mismatch repair protein MutL
MTIMGRIHLLEDAVINKIAAGEVVERPASVVKELVENAIDAQATEIRVELEEGGRKKIVVSDNGFGMSAEDARSALLRHATSKITVIEDLFLVNSMGFRGEALASIASVSRFTLMTRLHDAEVGTKISCDALAGNSEKAWTGGPGTTMAVESLFFNIPVREKFLKAPGTEFAYCLEYLQAVALARPEISFVVTHNGREQFSAPAVCDRSDLAGHILGEAHIRQRASKLIGNDSCSELLYLTDENQYGQIEALISPPGVEKPTAKQISTFVNRRLVKDKAVRFGIMRGYHSHLLRGKFPRAIIFLTIDPTLFDVNVHPSKEELRFQYPGEMQNLISMGIRNRIRTGDWVKIGDSSEPEVALAQPKYNGGEAAVSRTPNLARSPRTDSDVFRQDSVSHTGGSGYSGGPATRSMRSFNGYEPAVVQQTGRDLFSPDCAKIPMPVAPITERIDWDSAKYLGSFASCYIMVEVNGGMLVVDQHAFHERIIFERLMTDRSILKQRQPLLVPEAIELSVTDIARLKDRAASLKEIGFEFDVLSDTLLEVTSVPTILAGKELIGVFAELAAANQQGIGDKTLEELSTLSLATIACHSAVRAGEELEERDFRMLVNEAQSVDFYHNCPHGRRVFRWFKKSEITGWFDR